MPSAPAYADLLQGRTTRPDAVAACCGPPTNELSMNCPARLAPPRIVMDVRPELSDVCRREPIVAYDDEVFNEVYERMKEHNIGAVPVLDRQGRFKGLLTLLDLLKVVFEGDRAVSSSQQFSGQDLFSA